MLVVPLNGILKTKNLLSNHQFDVVSTNISVLIGTRLFSVSYQKLCDRAIRCRSRNLRMAPDRYFRFHWNCKQPPLEARNSI